MITLRPPEPLHAEHRRDRFDCGEVVLNDWFRQRALNNHLSGASRVFVVADSAGEVFGYYALAAGAVTHGAATGSVRRNMPDPVPVLVLGRLAVDRCVQGRQLGSAMLADAVRRATRVSAEAGVRALLVHALNERALGFYLRYGFSPSPLDPMTLMLRLY
ncbi:MAG: GNAT family N-acetyltransferase [Pseudazoarcus pumilus]|nr:GNAT family N-acetyltransferase [Pseudazoarcus pumilus]